MQNTALWVGTSIAALLVIVAIVFVVLPRNAMAPSQGSATSTMGSTTTVNLGGGITARVPAGLTLHLVSTVPEPDLNQSVIYASNLPAAAVTELQAQITTLTASLKENPSQGEDWIELGVDYKIAGDYNAAASVWTYLTQIAPTSPIAFADLGDLYQNFLVNYPKAETNYLEAVKLEPNDIDLYSDLFTLYRYQYKTNTSDATEIVTQGLAANPGNATLLQLKQELASSTQN